MKTARGRRADGDRRQRLSGERIDSPLVATSSPRLYEHVEIRLFDRVWATQGVAGLRLPFNGAFDFGRNVNNPLDTGYAYSNSGHRPVQQL
ncbi:MAG TPA: hypothetical protein VL285_18515 [Bryobacteraceae bacterium]|nr:hypothetical protein [Bryobacteraceae bacterium]